MKILFLITEDWAFISHRLHLAKYAKKMGHKVAVLCKINNVYSEINSTEINLELFYYLFIEIINTINFSIYCFFNSSKRI